MKKRTYHRLTKKQKRYLIAKRRFDKAASLAGLMILSPLIGGIVLAIRLEDGPDAPVIFTQERIGQNGRHFQLYKFRTMKTDTPHDVPTHLLENPDQYITRTGRFLRKYSLDELPQLINILRGEMSVIGPRPALYNQDDLIAPRRRRGIHQVKPGLTGFAQCHGRDELEIPEKVRLDAIYLRRLGLRMDLDCFLDTVRSVVRSDGVVEGGTGTMQQGKADSGEAAASLSQPAFRPAPGSRKLMIFTNHSYMLYRFRKELIDALLKKKGYEVVISTPFVGHEDDLAAMGARCIETPIDRRGMDPGTDLALLRTYRQQLQSECPDKVLTYSIKPNIYAGILCRRMQIPYSANVQGLGTAFQNRKTALLVTMLYRHALKQAHTVFFENRTNANEFLERRIIPERKITVVNGAGINLEEYPYVPLWKKNDTERTVHFLYLGRIMREKGCSELLAAVKHLYVEGQDIILDLVGFFEDDYEAQVTTAEKAGYVKYHGFQEDPRPYYAAADCIVMPSWHEGMSNVNLEAAAVGRPVITTDIPGCREAVEDGVTGILCASGNTESLYEAMKRFLSLSDEERTAMGSAARQKMEAEFAKEEIVEQTLNAMNA